MILGKNAQNVQKITDLIKENTRTTLLELEQDTGISKKTIGRIVTKDLKLKKTPAKFIPRFLTNEQKLCRLATCENMLEMTRTDPEWKDKIITGDETWVYDYDPETKRQSAEWRGQDIAPNDFFLFPKLKAVLKGRHFDTRDDIIEKSLLALKSIPKELYENCFDNLGETMALNCGTTADWLLMQMTFPTSHKTVFVLDHSPDFLASCEQHMDFDIFTKTRQPGVIPLAPISKSLWTCTLEAALEYCRIVWDIYPTSKLSSVPGCARDGATACYYRTKLVSRISLVTKSKKSLARRLVSRKTRMLGRSYIEIRYLVCDSKVHQLNSWNPEEQNHSHCINFVFNFSLRSFDSVDRLLVYMQPFCRPTDTFQNPFARYTLCILARSVSLVSPILSSEVVVVKSGRLLATKLSVLVQQHYNLASTTVTGIPMKCVQEEQNANSSANYDVELLHPAAAHHEVFKTGRSVMLEMPRKSGSKILSHMLSSHGGEILIHTLGTGRSVLEDPPSISEGCGGRVTDYRINRVDRMDEKNETQDAEEYTAEGENNPATTSDRVTHRTEIEVQSFDGTYPAAQFFRTYDQKTDWDGLTNTEKVLRLPRYLNNKPLEHFRRLRMETQHYIQVRQTFLDLYPETNEATYAQYFSMKLAGQPNLEEYYRNKTALGLQLGLPQEVILETLTEGLPPSDQRLVRIVPPENLGAWFRLVQRIRGSGAPSPRHPDEHAPPLLGPYAPVRPSPRTVPTRSTPPTDCRFCGGLHWHSECRLRQAPQLPRASGDARAARSAQLAEQRPRAQPHHQASRAQATGITKGAPDQQPTVFHVVDAPLPFGILGINTLRKFKLKIDFAHGTMYQLDAPLSPLTYHFAVLPESPVTLVTKRDKTKRFCIDYWKVNEVISSDVHPLPRIEDILDRLARAKYFSTADVSSAYWQVPIHPDSRPLLAFATIDGLYQPTRLPFGLKTSPQIYERAINQVLQGHGLDCVAHYFDDFVIYSETLEEHQEHLRRFFAFCDAENLQLNLTKCEFFRQTIEFLGYTITAGTTTPLIRNTDVIHAIPPPNNRKTLQSFLGAVNVYNKFIPDYARLRTPLNNLLKKDVTWDWDDKCQKAFTSLKESLTQHPVLHLYKDELPCQVYCDASTLGIAGVLKQVHSAGKAYPVQYFSRALRVHERNYTISELECLAIVESVEKFRVYLMGRKFTIFSDHHALQWLKTIKNPSGRLFRWSLRLSCYEYEVRYIKGSLQHEADLLSRNPFCGFLDATIIKNHQLTPSGESKLTIDRNGLQTLKRRGVTKIVVPDALVPDLLTKVHSRYNHPGISQMTRLISTQYYWKGMSEDISKTTKACAICQSTKHPRGPTFGELGQLPVATQPFDLVALDTIAGLAKYGNAKTYLHVVVDHFSRYTWTFPSKSTSLTTYQQVIKRVLQDGSPKRLLTDRAPAFTSPKFRKFLINRNIHPLLTTSNNPQANGLCERLNATLTGKLRLLHLENPKAAWTKLAKRVTVVYNNTPHSVTGFPPGYLMFGVLPPELTEHVNPYPVLTTARRIAHERTQAKHLKDKHAYDQQHKTPHFEPGDLVLVKVYHHPNTGKLAPYFTGPYEILEIISPNVVRINRPNQPLNRNTDTVHVNKLQYYNENIRYIAPPTLIPHPAKPQSRTLPPLFEHLTPDLFTVERFAPTIGNCTTTTPVDPQCNIIAQRDIPQPAISRPTHITKVKTPIPTVRADPKPIPLQARFFRNVKTFPLFHLLYLINLFILPTVLLPMATLLYVSVYTLQPNRLFQLQEALFEITIAVVELIHRTIGIILPELWTILVHSHALVALIGEIIGEIFQTLFRARQVE
ncbi:hypothetical protein LAZ67_18000851 [Cordylochernes scorpioides]|uniref:RNA-directed DNA polymerase n=1 Tax=Cordylochernes scorpioides TaxID=51811 RepID=A0ABY6LF76_9ARAC|nr:hypothetical protein LAZ67_18000851 [Cordylochernes scorpioides]